MVAPKLILNFDHMSYITLTRQYKENLKTKVVRYIKDELKGMEVEFDSRFNASVHTQYEIEERFIEGIDEEGNLIGKNTYSDYVDISLDELDVETLSYMLDQLMEVNYKLLVL